MTDAKVIEYLAGRGVVDVDLIEMAGITFEDNRIWFPWFDAAGRQIYRIGRSVNGSEPKYRNQAGERPPLFASPGAWADPVVGLVEGPIDALALCQTGTPAFATCTAGLSDAGAEILTGRSIVYAIPDNDEAGERWLASVVEQLAVRTELRVGRVQEPHKDVADLAATGDLEDVAEVLVRSERAMLKGYELEPTDWVALLREGIPPVDYLDEPYFPRGARIWIWGATGTSKSIYAMWKAAALSRAGHRVAYFSEENPLPEDLRRIGLLRPAPGLFRWFHRSGMDLQDPTWVQVMLAAASGCALVVFDSWTDLWHGDEGDNRAVQEFDATVLKPLQAVGATPVVVHHTGHRYMFSDRKGATAGRGASSLGQKADVTLEFKGEADNAFTIVYGKARIGGELQPNRTFRIIDTDDQRIDVVEVEGAEIRAVGELAERMVEAILTASKGFLTTSELRAAVGGSATRKTEALSLLEAEPRIESGPERVTASDGKLHSAKVWRPAHEGLF